MRRPSWFEPGAVVVGVLLWTSSTLAQTETAVVTGKSDTSDACLAVATAKQAQWNQTPLLIRETKSYSDGSTKLVETVFTGDHAYAHYIGMAWNTTNLDAPERGMKSAELTAKAMRLESCQLAGPAATANAHSYTFTYLPDRDGSHSAGQMVIADSTGLPLEQDIVFNAAHPNSRMPVKITATFAYGDEARLPRDAARAEIEERERQQRSIRELQQRSMTQAPM